MAEAPGGPAPARALPAPRTAFVEHELGEIEIALIAGNAVQLGQPHFDDLVSWPDGAECLVEQLGAPQRDIQQAAFPRGLIMRYRCLVKMTEIV